MGQKENKTSCKWLAIKVGVIALLAVVAYIWNFWGWPPSGKTQDWANFATYISGTVGLVVLFSTLISALITLSLQRKQIDRMESDSKRNIAYSKAEKIFPLLAKDINEKYNLTLNEFLSDLGIIESLPRLSDGNKSVREFFNNCNSTACLKSLDPTYKMVVFASLTIKGYNACVFISKCLIDAPELEEYFRYVLGKDNINIIKYSMLYYREVKAFEFEECSSWLNITSRDVVAAENLWVNGE